MYVLFFFFLLLGVYSAFFAHIAYLTLLHELIVTYFTHYVLSIFVVLEFEISDNLRELGICSLPSLFWL
jgi:hypothetical protein